MNRSETIGELAAAMAAFGGDVTNPPQTRTASVEMRGGGKYTYRYADLADVLTHVRPHLARHGLIITQDIITTPNSVEVTSTLMHKSGEYLTFSPLVLPGGGTPQQFGSVITYARRYSLLAALGIASESDDDAAGASPAADTHKAPAARQSGVRKITDKQLGKLHAVANEAGVSDEMLHKAAKRDFSCDSLKELTTKQASELIDRLGALPAKPAEPEPPAEPEAEDAADYWPDEADDIPVPGMDAEQARKSWEKPKKAQGGLL